MDDFVTPTLNVVSFGFGFAVAMFWPVYVALAGAALWTALRRSHVRIALTVGALNALPFVALLAVGLATGSARDVGPVDGPLANGLENLFVCILLAGPAASAVFGLVALSHRLSSKRGANAYR